MTENKPLVTVIIITYNHEKYISQTIEGVLMQKTNFDYEFIICNDCSPDNTDEVINNYLKTHPLGNKIQYFNHKVNKGMVDNFIFAVSKSKGKYIALCEGDDYWISENKLQKQIDFLEQNPDFSICFHTVKILKDNQLHDDWMTKRPNDVTTCEDLINYGNYIQTPSLVFRNKKSEYPVHFRLSPVGDYFLYILLTEDGSKIKCIDEAMAVYRYGVGVHSTLNKITHVINWHRLLILINLCIYPKFNQTLIRKTQDALNAIVDEKIKQRSSPEQATDKESNQKFKDIFLRVKRKITG